MKATALETKLNKMLEFTDEQVRLCTKGRVHRFEDGTVTVFIGNTNYKEFEEKLLKLKPITVKSLSNNKYLEYTGE